MFTRRIGLLCALSVVLILGCDPESQVDDKQDQPDDLSELSVADIADLGGSDLPTGAGLSSYIGISPTPLVGSSGGARSATSCDEVKTWLARREIERWLRDEFVRASQSGMPWSDSHKPYIDRDMGGGEPPPQDYSLPNLVDARVGETTPMVAVDQHLYVSHHSSRLNTYKAWPAELFAQTDEQGFLSGLSGPSDSVVKSGDALLHLSSTRSRWGNHTYIQHYNLTDPAAPAPLGQLINYEGALRAGRVVGDRLLLINQQELQLAKVWSERLHDTLRALVLPADLSAITLSEAQDRARTVLLADLPLLREQINLRAFLPQPLTEGAGCADVILPERMSSDFTISLLYNVSLAEPSDAKMSAFLGPIGYYYTAPDALYLMEDVEVMAFDTPSPTLHVMRLPLMPAAPLRLDGSASLEGAPFSEFGMSEHEGHLRVVTSLGVGLGAKLTILGPRPNGWGEVGSLPPIAPDEQVTAVRAVGSQLYVMTAKGSGFTTPSVPPSAPDYVPPFDPLFVIDAANPAAPVVLGELDFPGFSVHIEPISATRLFSVGGDEGGELKLQLFDITDRSAPRIERELSLASLSGSDNAWREVVTNRLGFTYHAERGLISIPLGTRIAVIELDEVRGLRLLGEAAVADRALFCPPGALEGCGDYSDAWRRSYSLFVERFLYAVSSEGVSVWDTSVSPLALIRALPFTRR